MALSRNFPIVPGSRPDAVIRNRSDLYNYIINSDRPPAVRILALGLAERRIRERVFELEHARDELLKELNTVPGSRNRILNRINEIREHLNNENIIVDECFSASDVDLLIETSVQYITLAGAETLLEEIDTKINDMANDIKETITNITSDVSKKIIQEHEKSNSAWRFWPGVTIGIFGNLFFGLLLIFAAWFIVKVDSVSLKKIIDIIISD